VSLLTPSSIAGASRGATPLPPAASVGEEVPPRPVARGGQGAVVAAVPSGAVHPEATSDTPRHNPTAGLMFMVSISPAGGYGAFA